MDGFHDNLADLGHLDNEHSNRDTPLMKTASSKPLFLPQMNTNVLYSNTTTTGITAKRKPSLNCRSSDKEERLTRSNLVTIQAFSEPMSKASCQCRMKLGAVDAAASGTFKKQAHGHGRENEKSLLCFGCDFSGWYNCGKIIKTVVTRCHYFKAKMHQIRFQLPRTPLRELKAIPQTISLKNLRPLLTVTAKVRDLGEENAVTNVHHTTAIHYYQTQLIKTPWFAHVRANRIPKLQLFNKTSPG